MLPEELATLRHRADLLRTVAWRLRRLDLDTVVRLADERTWRGPAAARFVIRVDAHRRALDDCADALTAHARRWDTIG